MIDGLMTAQGVPAEAAGDYWSMLFVFVLATFIGLGVIRRVSRLLYTPLMSLTNAISAIAVVGSIAVTGAEYPKAIRILGAIALYWMNDPKTARHAVVAGVAGMLVAVLATWFQPAIVHHGWIVVAIAAGFAVGVPLSRVPLTAVPQRTALSHAFGGLAAGLVGTAEYFLGLTENPGQLTAFRMSAIVAEVILGFLTFTGSLMAAGKLQEVKWIPQRPVTYPGQNFVNIGVLVAAVALGAVVVLHPTAAWSAQAFYAITGLAVLFGVLLIIPIGGADMPTVISILNSYAGLSAVAMSFENNNKLLVTPGALDGSSGLILSIIMCRAMNRSFTNVLFGAFGQVQQTKTAGEQKV